MSLEHAQQWCEALGNDVDALRDLYADWFTLEHTMMDDHMADTITDTDMLKEQLGAIAGGENGTYTFTAREWCGDRSDHGLIHWDVKIEGAKTFRGVPVPEGTTLEGIGSTFHAFDEDGKVRFESTYWEDCRILAQLGVPIVRPHYWRADFDMEAFLAGNA
jgi:steroid delta-isomerase-like uncharacterized protein